MAECVGTLLNPRPSASVLPIPLSLSPGSSRAGAQTVPSLTASRPEDMSVCLRLCSEDTSRETTAVNMSSLVLHGHEV